MKALSKLFARLALRYSVTQGISRTVTADIGGLPLDKALEALVAAEDASGGLV